MNSEKVVTKYKAFPDDVDKFLGKLEVCVGPYMYSGESHEDESSDTYQVDFMKVCEFKADTLSEVFAMSADAVPMTAKALGSRCYTCFRDS